MLKRLVWLLLGIAGLGAMFIAINWLFESDPVPNRYQAKKVLVKLTERDGACQPPPATDAFETETIRVKKRGTIIWVVDNGCSAEALFRVDNFRSGDTEANANPIDGDTPRRVVIRPGERGALALTIAANAGHTQRDVEYEYDVLVNGQNRDQRTVVEK